MKTACLKRYRSRFLQAFTLVELMVAMVASIALVGTVFMLLIETVLEQRNGLADSTVEQKAYTLRANLTKCLRSMSANMGATLNNDSQVVDGHGTPIGYHSIYLFTPINSTYVMASITFNPANGQVIYIPNVTTPSVQTIWMSNTSSSELTQFLFNTSKNLDGSLNGSLVNVSFQMDDNGFSQQTANNNPANIYRSFSVQMRNDY